MNIAYGQHDVAKRGETEPAVEQAGRELLFIANATPVLTVYVDTDQRFTFANNAYAKWRNLSLPEIIGKRVVEVVGPEAFEQFRPDLEDALTGRTITTEIPIPFPDKTIRYLAVYFVPDIDEAGKVRGVGITLNDVTTSRVIEADLRRKEAELRDFLENGTVGLHWVSPDGIILWANRAELELLGYSYDEYVGHHIAEFHADEHVINEILTRLSSRETLHNYEAQLKAKDGSTKHVLISSNVLWDEEGNFVHTRCFTRDITERRSVEESLHESEERHQAVLEQVSEAIFLLDPHTKRFVSANRAFQSLLGYTANELLDMTIYDVLPYDRERIDRAVQRALVEGDYRVSDRLYIRKDGSLVNVEVSITPVFYSGKRVLCEIVRDITERKQAEQERNQLLVSEQAARTSAEEALSIRDQLLAVVSHDLKNPLAAIRGNAQLIKQRIEQADIPDTERMLAVVARVDRAQAKMNMLINELMDFGRLQAAMPLTLQRRPTDLIALVNQVVADQQETTTRHAIRAEAALPDLIGQWDGERLERVIANLVSNAIKYSPDGGEIVVKVTQATAPSIKGQDKKKTGRWAVVAVKDRGLGIPPEDLPHIFEWFRRAGSVAGRISGAGIGLASSLHAVREHGGTIDVVSKPGTGSTFTVRLPIVPKGANQPG